MGFKSDNIFILVFGMFLLLPPLIYYIFSKIFYERSQNRYQEMLESFKKEATKITAEIDSYQINSNNRSLQNAVNRKHNFFNSITKSFFTERIKNKTKTFVAIKISYSNITEESGGYFTKDPETLKMILGMHKETYIYIDKKNPENKYLDLEFLE